MNTAWRRGMASILVGVGLFWMFVVTCFLIVDLFKWVRNIKMSKWNSTGAMGVASQNAYQASQTQSGGMTNIMAETIHSSRALNLNGHGLVWNKPDGNNVDIAKAAEIFWFFLAQHPEIVEQFNAIEKIKES